MTVPASVGIGSAAGIVLIVAGLLVALAVSRLDLGVVRDDLALARANADSLTVERDEARTRVANIQKAMHQQRMNTYTLLGRIRQLEGDNESIELATPLPSEALAADVVAEAEAILRQVGGQP